jgi:hypothetical protein
MPSLLPSHMPLPLSLLHEQSTTNNVKAPSSALLPPLPPLLSCKQGVINNVEVPSLLPSRVLLPLPSLQEQGATNSAKVLLSSTPEQRTADEFKAPCQNCVSRGQPTGPGCYCLGSRHCHIVQARDDQQCQGAVINIASARMSRG